MNKNDLNEARTNPDFLIYLEAAMQNSIKNQNIEMMYEILDTMLVLDLEEEKQKTEEEIKYLKGFLISVEKKLSNEKFVANAKPEIVETERKKQSDAQEKIALLEEKLKTL